MEKVPDLIVGSAPLMRDVRRRSRCISSSCSFRAFASDLDDLIEIEDELMESVGPPATVDGHDFGSGEGNIFILTDDPAVTFEIVLPVLKRLSRHRDAIVAYRTVGRDEFTVIWPKDFTGDSLLRSAKSPNKQLQRTVMDKVPRHMRRRAAAELRRYASLSLDAEQQCPT